MAWQTVWIPNPFSLSYGLIITFILLLAASHCQCYPMATKLILGAISRSDGGEYKDDCPLGCYTVYCPQITSSSVWRKCP